MIYFVLIELISYFYLCVYDVSYFWVSLWAITSSPPSWSSVIVSHWCLKKWKIVAYHLYGLDWYLESMVFQVFSSLVGSMDWSIVLVDARCISLDFTLSWFLPSFSVSSASFKIKPSSSCMVSLYGLFLELASFSQKAPLSPSHLNASLRIWTK